MNPSETIALASVIGTAVLGIAGMAATFAIARFQARQQLSLAREERHQRRIEEAYAHILEFLSSAHAPLNSFARFAAPEEPDYTFDQLVTTCRRFRDEAVYEQPLAMLAASFLWSKEVAQLVDRYRYGLIYLAGYASGVVEVADCPPEESGGTCAQSADSSESADVRPQIDEVRQLDQQIRARIRQELTTGIS
ncbi:MAG: hypothetical protein ACRDXX_05665 [Stackebrandtia sp.]